MKTKLFKKRIFYFLLLALTLNSAFLSAKKVDEWNLEIKKIPDTIEEFIKMRDEYAKTPAGGAAMFVVALEMYVRDEKTGLAALTVAVDQKFLVKDSNGGYYKGYKLEKFKEDQIKTYIKNKFYYLPKSYFKGTSSENAYALPKPPYKMYLFTNTYSFVRGEGYVKVFVQSTGTSPTPVTLKKNDKGLWKAFEWSSFLMGVKKPPEKTVEDDL